MELWDPFEAFMGPYFEKPDNADSQDADKLGSRTLAFYIDDRHVNAHGICHGGTFLTFADATLGSVAWQVMDKKPVVTLSVQTNFLRPGKVGDLVTVRPELVRETRSILFIRGTFMIDEEPAFTVTSLWKVIGAK